MTQVMLGKDLIQHSKHLELIPEIVELIDPEGFNIIEEKFAIKGGYFCLCLFKFKGEPEPFEVTVILKNALYKKLVFNVDINSLNEVH